MGGIKQHGSGIQITFIWNGQRYRPTLRIPYTATNIKYAQRLKGEIERSISLGSYTLDKHIENFPTSRISLLDQTKVIKIDTFRELAYKWKLTINNLAAGTKDNYIKSLNFWIAHFGNYLITDINYSKIVTIANSQKWESKNRNNMLIPLRKVFELACLDEMIAQNPTLKIKNEKVQKPPPNPLTLIEVNLILVYMQKKFNEHVYNYFEFAFFTGCRPQEIIALKWKSINLTELTARIERVRTAKVDRETTKTNNVRDIELNSRALAALKRQELLTFAHQEYVFLNPVTGLRWNSEASQRKEYWNPTLKALELSKRVQYQTRHTFATMNLMAGANPMWLSRQMGHSNMQMLLTTYSKWIDGADKKKEVSKIESFFEDECHKNATRVNI